MNKTSSMVNCMFSFYLKINILLSWEGLFFSAMTQWHGCPPSVICFIKLKDKTKGTGYKDFLQRQDSVSYCFKWPPRASAPVTVDLLMVSGQAAHPLKLFKHNAWNICITIKLHSPFDSSSSGNPQKCVERSGEQIHSHATSWLSAQTESG